MSSTFGGYRDVGAATRVSIPAEAGFVLSIGVSNVMRAVRGQDELVNDED
jgi:hypothetical protein